MENISQLTSTTIVRKCDAILVQELDNELVMADISQGCYFGTSSTGKRIWELLDSCESVAEICNCLCAEYAIDHNRCLQETTIFISQLVDKNLVKIISERP